MPVITLASVKGGVGKSTALLSLASDIALSEGSVAVLDADPNGHASRIGAKMAKRLSGVTFSSTGGITEANILASIKKARAEADYVFVDLPGVSSKLTLLGLARSNLVIIPVQASEMDIHDALQTVENVKQAAEAADKTIAACFLLSRWPVTIESRAAKETRKRLTAKAPDVPVLQTPLMDRTAFKEMTFNGAPPRLVEPEGNAAANVAAIRQEVLSLLSAKVEDAA
ncbi:ParA family protein [Azospirillum sp. SYSU D00513]|uniref:ParA family protein n=1 Tax=Azospirillum sp. SYSU D00513 TaxID=2812561 RepID=UPI001A95FB36|nr:ParA family protein [Azospirillum sp. SYSU D00513]